MCFYGFVGLCFAVKGPRSSLILPQLNMQSPSLNCTLGVLSRPDGSATFCEDKTVVTAGVYGPIEVRMQKLLIDKASVECHYRPKKGYPDISDRFNESIIRNVCEVAVVASLFPRTSVLITIQEMQNDGHLLSCAVNASCMALINSGVDMNFMFAGVTCFLPTEGVMGLIAPQKQQGMKALFVFVFDSSEGKVIAVHTQGSYTKQHYDEALKLCSDESKNLFKFFTSILLRK